MTQIIDIRGQYKKDAHKIKGLQQSNGDFKSGDVVEFWAGYDDDIRYRAEVSGVIGNEIYIVWDCYWFPIKDDNVREIKKYNRGGK